MDGAPEIRYIQAGDGMRIACWEIGQGDPIVQLPAVPFSHIEFEWRMPELRRTYQLLALRRRLIRYDSRGMGLSERNVDDFSLDSFVLDLEAVMQLAGQPAALVASLYASPVAIAYAARHPDHVSALLLWCPVAQGALDLQNQALAAIIWLWENDWDLYRRTAAHAFMGWSEPEAARTFADYIDAAITQATGKRIFDTIHEEYDVLDLLSQVRCPTLVMYRPEFPFAGAGVIEDIAARIPGSTLVAFEGTWAVPYVGDWRSVARTMYGFLGITPEMIGDRDRRGLRLISRRNDSLSERERDVVRLIVRGLTNREIAEELFIAEKTVENHVGRILDKLDLRSRTTLAAYAVEHGIARSA
jgi:DNA-binding CsgD family transcriptional regulator/pimeloyl-ACP methyl ester carboxylesterase